MFGFLSLLCRDLQAVPWEARVFELGARIGRARKGPRLLRPFVILERIGGSQSLCSPGLRTRPTLPAVARPLGSAGR